MRAVHGVPPTAPSRHIVQTIIVAHGPSIISIKGGYMTKYVELFTKTEYELD